MRIIVAKKNVRFSNVSYGDILEDYQGNQYRVCSILQGSEGEDVELEKLDDWEAKAKEPFSLFESKGAIDITTPVAFSETYVHPDFGDVPYPNGRCGGR